jgi:hypothetical protein
MTHVKPSNVLLAAMLLVMAVPAIQAQTATVLSHLVIAAQTPDAIHYEKTIGTFPKLNFSITNQTLTITLQYFCLDMCPGIRMRIRTVTGSASSRRSAKPGALENEIDYPAVKPVKRSGDVEIPTLGVGGARSSVGFDSPIPGSYSMRARTRHLN